MLSLFFFLLITPYFIKSHQLSTNIIFNYKLSSISFQFTSFNSTSYITTILIRINTIISPIIIIITTKFPIIIFTSIITKSGLSDFWNIFLVVVFVSAYCTRQVVVVFLKVATCFCPLTVHVLFFQK